MRPYTAGVDAGRVLAGVSLGALVLVLATGCQALLGADATPVPGAAATLTRGSRTAIPTPVRTPSPAAAIGVASPSRGPSPSPSPSAVLDAAGGADEGVRQVEGAMAASLGQQELPGVEALLLDRVSLSSAEGGQVLSRDTAAAWLRERAGPGLHIVQVDRSSLSVMLEVRTEGWLNRPPLAVGRVTFNLHRYAPNGTPDDDHGDWRIDVIGAE